MKMFIKTITIALIVLLITGCSQNALPTTGNVPPTTINDPIPSDTAPSNLIYSPLLVDWVYHHTLDELMQFATNVFEGKLTQISFRVVSFKDVNTEKTYSYLYTIYDFEVSISYKGENKGTVHVGIIGGMEGYKVAEQYNAMVDAGIYREKSGIPILSGYTHPTVGESYLIIGIDLGNGFLDVPNQNQFSYLPNRSDQDGYFGYQDIKDYFSKS